MKLIGTSYASYILQPSLPHKVTVRTKNGGRTMHELFEEWQNKDILDRMYIRPDTTAVTSQISFIVTKALEENSVLHLK